MTDDKFYEMFCLIGMQAVHQWRFMNDEIYRMDYFDLLEECGLSMQILAEKEYLFIPVGENTSVVFEDKSVSQNV